MSKQKENTKGAAMGEMYVEELREGEHNLGRVIEAPAGQPPAPVETLPREPANLGEQTSESYRGTLVENDDGYLRDLKRGLTEGQRAIVGDIAAIAAAKGGPEGLDGHRGTLRAYSLMADADDRRRIDMLLARHRPEPKPAFEKIHPRKVTDEGKRRAAAFNKADDPDSRGAAKDPRSNLREDIRFNGQFA